MCVCEWVNSKHLRGSDKYNWPDETIKLQLPSFPSNDIYSPTVLCPYLHDSVCVCVYICEETKEEDGEKWSIGHLNIFPVAHTFIKSHECGLIAELRINFMWGCCPDEMGDLFNHFCEMLSVRTLLNNYKWLYRSKISTCLTHSM